MKRRPRCNSHGCLDPARFSGGLTFALRFGIRRDSVGVRSRGSIVNAVKSTTRATCTYRVNEGTYVLFSEALPISAGSAYLSRKPRLCTYAILCNTSQRGRACLSRFSRSLPLLLAPRLSPIEREPSMDPRLCAPAISFLPVGHSASARFFERGNTSARVRSGVKSHERISVRVSDSDPEERARRVSREREGRKLALDFPWKLSPQKYRARSRGKVAAVNAAQK